MNKAVLLEKLLSGREEWDSMLAQIDKGQMTQPGVSGEWSVKDIIAHVTWFEREMVDLLSSHELAGSDLWNLHQDERNAAIYQQNKDRSLNDVLAESKQVFQHLVKSAQTLTEEDLTDPARFANMPADWIPWKIIADNSYDHYVHHMPDLRAWLSKG